MLFSIHWFNRTYNIESTIVMVLEYVTFTALYIYISHMLYIFLCVVFLKQLYNMLFSQCHILNFKILMGIFICK